MDIIQITTRVDRHTLGCGKMETDMVTAFTDMLIKELYIMGSSLRIKERDTVSRSMPTIMSMMDNGKTTTDLVKQCTHTLKQE
jgi:hypothetical protein